MASNRSINGVLTMPASLKNKKASADSSLSGPSTRPGSPRLRLIIRRLPPGLTLAEFESALDTEWQVGAGRIEWLAFKNGKISKDPSKPSRPARAYLRVREQGLLDALSAALKQVSFQDAKNTSKDPCLLGPPSLEFAPYGRVTGGRVRKDGRQGTIDQDPEFIYFLQSLTEPATRPTANGEAGELTGSKPEKVNTTPLVEFLREKKANKGKESSTSKISKSQGKGESKEAKSDKADSKKISVIKKEGQKSSEKAKTDKATQDAVKSVDKSAAAPQAKPDNSASASPAKAPVTAPAPAKRERERGSASAAAKILRRDLGLIPKGERLTSRGPPPASRARAGVEPESKASPPQTPVDPTDKISQSLTIGVSGKTNDSQPDSSVSSGAASPRENKVAAPNSQQANRSTPAPAGRSPRLPPTPSSGAKSAFLKHANISQGVTEPLLHATFSAFGEVTRCEIDRKKGFGYVDFQQPESLAKAMAASPVKVGEKGGQVMVLENKNVKAKPVRPTKPSNEMKDTERQQQLQPSIPSTTKDAEKESGTEEVPKASPSPAAPTAPRGTHASFRGGRPHHQHGPRRDNAESPRGGFGGRGTVREGKASLRGRGGSYESNRRGGGGPTTGKKTGTASSAMPAAEPSTPTGAANKAAEPAG